jgi:uncharacterized membrane protein
MTITLHPPTVHFPVALLLVGSILELWVLRRPNADWLIASRLMLRLGWWLALLAVLTGFSTLIFNAERIQRDLGWINAHALTGLIIVAVYWRLAIGRPVAPPLRQRLLLLGIILIALTGWLGGRLAFGLGWR